MKKKLLTKALPFLGVFLFFTLVAGTYFYPVFQGETLFQSDIQQFKGISKELVDYRESNQGEESYWTNRLFGGMPSYAIGAYYPNDYIKKLDKILRFLPRPADYLFLYLSCFFILLQVLRIDLKWSLLGSLAYGLSTYSIIILGVGHNAKAHAIAYMPLVIAGILLVLERKKLLWGFLLTTLALALEISAFHPQMTYYLSYAILIIMLFYLYEAFKNQNLFSYIKKVSVLLVSAILAVCINATLLLSNKEYAKVSTRSKTELTENVDGSPLNSTSGLSRSYITQYSYGVLETLNLLIPNFMGGSTAQDIGKDSKTYKVVKEIAGVKQALAFSKGAPMYWGQQPIVGAPAYIGAVVLFLFVLALFTVKELIRKWVVSIFIIALILSWGKNFFITDLFIDFVPFYDKFRAVSSIQVLIELVVPLFAVYGLHKYFTDDKILIKDKKEYLKKSFYFLAGITLFFTLFGTNLLSFESVNDLKFKNYPLELLQAFIEDRKHIFFQDSLRSFILILITATLLWFFGTKKENTSYIFAGLLILIVFDLAGVDKRYVSKDNFVDKIKIEKPFEMSSADRQILKDTSHYRVANLSSNIMNDGSTSYFHNSIGGYHAAKPKRFQELFDYQISKDNKEVFNFLNTKYFIVPNSQQNELVVKINHQANGNAWFVDKIKWVSNADQEIKAISDFNSKKTAIIDKRFDNIVQEPKQIDYTASISLVSYAPNKMVYKYTSETPQVALFSEIYYKDGWVAKLENKEELSIFRSDYILRGVEVPAGNHILTFYYKPKVIYTGSVISLIAYIIFLLALIFGIYRQYSIKPKKLT